MSQVRTQEGGTMEPEDGVTEETFLKDLYAYMKNRDTPIERIPHLGFKQIDLFQMFKTVQSLGGYNQVTAHQLWKQVYNKLGGNPRSTSAATCTRRHYEKLIMPYECYLRGEDNKDLTFPRQQKRPRCPSFPHDEEEALRGGKRSMAYGHVPAMHRNSHDFLDNRVRVIPIPLHLQHYFPRAAQRCHPTLHPPPTISTSLPHPDSRTFRVPPPLEVTERPEQHLAVLRTLANEYMSSSGWAEPLNLSCKEGGGISNVSQQPSSFSPTGSNKTPKFLNKVVPLYRAYGVAKEEGPEGLDTELSVGCPSICGTAKPSPADPSAFPLPALKRQVIDLTSSAVSNMSPPVTDATVKTEAFSTSPLWHHGPAFRDALTGNTSETDLQSRKGESPRPSQSPLNLSSSTMSPTGDSGRMEIQIPLALLQNWFKSTFAPGLRNRVSAGALQSAESQMKGSEVKLQMQGNAETLPGRENTSDLSFHQRQRHRDSSFKGGDRNFTGSYTKERHTVNKDHYTGISHHHHSRSPDITAGDWEPKRDCRGAFAPYHPDVFSKRVTGSSPYLQSIDYVARKSSPKGLTDTQDLVAGRKSSQNLSAPMKSPLGPHEQEQGSTGPYRREMSPVLLGPHEKAQSKKGPFNVFMVNNTSSSCQSLTQEEYLKLRQLISSSL
ncbi:hypothetical protein COCON_G00170550 [Conger conger]|uniref:ARID domain-containing protein n=1 Tax=Conger conger TaxID=82655 RepID=A0A9Q1HSG9_CONCO|nr:hypothetical protein COCON_G00170550 [Conger conger]